MSSYPYPRDAPAPADLNQERAEAYEQTVLRLLREYAVGKQLGIPREIIDVSLDGKKPDTRVVVTYHDQTDDRQHSGSWRLWADLEADHLTVYDPPEHVVSIFLSDWGEGSIGPDA